MRFVPRPPARHRRAGLWAMALLSLVLLGGGCTSPGRDVVVSLDEKLRDAQGRMPSVQVDLIAVPEAEFRAWRDIPVDEYWTEGNTLAASPNKFSMTFKSSDKARLLPKENDLWKTWSKKDATQLVAVAFIPGVKGSGKGEADPRRLLFPLDRQRWEKWGPIQITVQPTGLATTTRPLPE